MKWAKRQRMRFISEFIVKNGHINRSDLKEEFGISTPQASLDLQEYQKLYPGELVYDLNRKHYKLTGASQ